MTESSTGKLAYNSNQIGFNTNHLTVDKKGMDYHRIVMCTPELVSIRIFFPSVCVILEERCLFRIKDYRIECGYTIHLTIFLFGLRSNISHILSRAFSHPSEVYHFIKKEKYLQSISVLFFSKNTSFRIFSFYCC